MVGKSSRNRAHLGWLGAGAAICALLACTDRSTPVNSAENPAKIPFDTGVEGLPQALPMGEILAKDGDTVRLTVSYVAKWISGQKIRMLAYNGMVPGPTLKVLQGAEIILLLKNETNLPTTLHSHGVRLDYHSDGVPGADQPATDSGGTTAYRIRFPDPGIFWYHPHFREDFQMELGLYGSYLVAPKDTTYWPPVHREVVLMLDDVAMGTDGMQPFYSNLPDHSLMGRFGNTFLINGDTAFTMHVKRNETIRFYAVNASNARVYNLGYSRDMDLNILGADNGRFEFPSNRETYIVAPSERAIFQIWFNDGLNDYDTLDLWNVTPTGVSVLGHFVYDADTARPDLSGSITSKQSPQVAASIDPFRPFFDKLPDEEVLLSGYMDMSAPLAKAAAAEHDADPTNKMGVEWSDSVHGPAMLEMNVLSNSRNMHWSIKDTRTGKENHEINWVFKRGSKVLIRIRNDSASTGPNPNYMYHPMPHPIHFHGQRFLVVRENGKVPLEGLAWRDSYLIGRGFTVDLLLDADNPGDWMFHCHIAEHIEDDMMGHFRVLDDVSSEQIPFAWSLSLSLASNLDSLRRDTTLAVAIPETVGGSINGFASIASGAALDPAAVLDGFAYFENADNPALKISAPLGAAGAFSFRAADLLGAAQSVRVKAYVKAKTAAYRVTPDTLRLTLDRRGKLKWSLDLDLAGDTSLAGLDGEVSVVSRMQGAVSGKVNGFDPVAQRDTVYFRNMIYPELFADVPLRADGAFSVDASDLVGSLDGLHTLHVFLRPKTGQRQMDPDTVRIHVSIP
ncbi:MAG: FtsP/CotA-like multicopper oxidase with cupredoxin domain [Fibrobacteres bacterium]|nr:FtsP/CotA-like multicopper oxidase with cupredoxin domain [Fibrobacterota bacterium]